jgi:hypothetical protein
MFQRNDDGYIIDCAVLAQGELILDIISQEPIKNYIIIQNQLYDVNILYDYIKYKFIKEKLIATIPHTRRPFTKEILEEINNKVFEKSPLGNSKIIVELIELSKFPIQTQEYLLILEYEQRRKILDFEDYKIQILISEPDFVIDTLFNDYHYLLNNDISDEDVINAAKEYYRSLLFIPFDTISIDIIKSLVQNNGELLKYVPPERMTRAGDALASSSGL